MKLKDFGKFVKLAKNRRKSLNDYLKFQKFQARLIIKELDKRGLSINNKKVLEIGCGKGGYSLEFLKKTKNLIISDINRPKNLLKKNPKLKFKQFDACKRFPFKDNQFDFVFCCSIIEHLNKPKRMLKEVFRVLKDDGTLYLSYPPFYSLSGGHNFKPFHLLGEKNAVRIFNFIHKRNDVKSYKNKPGMPLFPLKIDSVKKMLKENEFKIKDTFMRTSVINFSKIPLLKELLTWHIDIIATKKD